MARYFPVPTAFGVTKEPFAALSGQSGHVNSVGEIKVSPGMILYQDICAACIWLLIFPEKSVRQPEYMIDLTVAGT